MKRRTHLSPVKSHSQTSEPKDNLNPTELKALKTLRSDTNISPKKADKRTTAVVINIEDKI